MAKYDLKAAEDRMRKGKVATIINLGEASRLCDWLSQFIKGKP